MIGAVVVALASVALFVWQDGAGHCQDGDRYVSRKRQPAPFHRRFTHWHPYLLVPLTWLALPLICALLGSWQRAALFCALPGVWFVVTHPTCVDLVGIAVALIGAKLWPDHPWAACFLVGLCGLVHERVYVYAALYAWSLPFALACGLGLGLMLLAAPKPAPPLRPLPVTPRNLHHHLVGHTTRGAISAHKPYQDLLSWEAIVWPLRALAPMAAVYGMSPAGWAAFAVAYASRVIGTDTGRFMAWGAPAMLLAMPADVPLWVVAAHLLTFRRMV